MPNCSTSCGTPSLDPGRFHLLEIGERTRAKQENALLISELEVVFANVIVGIDLIKDRHTVRCNLQY